MYLQFTLEDACFVPINRGEFLALHVAGLNEKRPSLLIGDTVLASAPAGCGNHPTYEGCIHHVLSDTVSNQCYLTTASMLRAKLLIMLLGSQNYL